MNAHKYEHLFSHEPTPEDIFDAHLFEEPLVPVGGDPTPAENVALTKALTAYANRSGVDDFTSLTGFLERYPTMRLERRAADESRTRILQHGPLFENTVGMGTGVEPRQSGDRPERQSHSGPGGGRAGIHVCASRTRWRNFDALLQSVEGRVFSGPATERMTGAREGLWNMENRPEIAFRCGPFALHRIKTLSGSSGPRNGVDSCLRVHADGVSHSCR